MPPTRKDTPDIKAPPPPVEDSTGLDEALEETFPASDAISTGAPEGFDPPPAKPSPG
ncbi:hypothetical protein [Roseomonas sp. KE2513]|uniref:hypothetical protein n=1 Tax=Roseomonas sp. KE2513 TaxID=2479202 RepID=UPI0018DF6B4A|nr:hypothetical protein [Roseomonas sp. KE2513]